MVACGRKCWRPDARTKKQPPEHAAAAGGGAAAAVEHAPGCTAELLRSCENAPITSLITPGHVSGPVCIHDLSKSIFHIGIGQGCGLPCGTKYSGPRPHVSVPPPPPAAAPSRAAPARAARAGSAPARVQRARRSLDERVRRSRAFSRRGARAPTSS